MLCYVTTLEVDDWEEAAGKSGLFYIWDLRDSFLPPTRVTSCRK